MCQIANQRSFFTKSPFRSADTLRLGFFYSLKNKHHDRFNQFKFIPNFSNNNIILFNCNLLCISSILLVWK